MQLVSRKGEVQKSMALYCIANLPTMCILECLHAASIKQYISKHIVTSGEPAGMQSDGVCGEKNAVKFQKRAGE